MRHALEMTLLSGKALHFDDPNACDVEIQDIAVPLANICRYAGQLPIGRWYSVAQHAVNTSSIVPVEHAYDALMHDTAEAFTNDVVTPLKLAVPLFKEIEQRLETSMALKLGFTYPLSPAVVLADAQMLALELRHLRGQDPAGFPALVGIKYEHLEPVVDLTSWSPEVAHEAFMRRYYELRKV